MENNFLSKLRRIIRDSQSIAKKNLDLIKLENGEDGISDLLKTEANKLITQFSNSYVNINGSLYASSKIHSAIIQFISNTQKSLETITLYLTFFKSIIPMLNQIEMLIDNEPNDDIIITAI